MKRSKLGCIALNSVLSALALTILSTAPVNAQSAVRFNGTTSHIKIGSNASLSFTDFTIEAWIKIEGRGRVAATGSGGGGANGLINLIPLVTKGRDDVEGTASREINYFLGYDSATRKLAADYEDKNASSNNHAVLTNIVLDTCSWTHVAVTCKASVGSGRQWVFYINGVSRETIAITGSGSNSEPQAGSLCPLTFGSSISYTGSAEGTSQGFFQGKMDEIRVWNVVRTASEISTNYNSLLTSGTGLMGRWALSEGTGNTTANTISTLYGTGILANTSLWTKDYNASDISASLDFDGVDDYVTLGFSPKLKSASFTIECWVRREGAGITTNTSGPGGNGFEGTTALVPIVAKGREESESAGLNMNYIVGIVEATGQLGADFEEANGTNHSVIGNTVLQQNTWYHVAVTYGSGEWKMYVNGVLDKQKTEAGNPLPEPNSIQNASIGSALNSLGVASGFFNGKIDEVRIWNTVRSQTEIQSNQYQDLPAATSLLGRWGFNEGQFNFIESSASNSCGLYGTLSGSSPLPLWSSSNFIPSINEALPYPANGTVDYGGQLFKIKVTNVAGSPVTVKMYARIQGSGAYDLIATNTNVTSGSETSFWWPTLLPLTAYEWFVQVTDGTNTVNGRVYTFTSSGIVPVKLLNFEALPTKARVELKWSTSNETNNKQFIVERSGDGKIFTSIMEIASQSGISPLSYYTAIDANPLTGVSYYRLKQVDNDGKYGYSAIVRVNFAEKAISGFEIYPNPVSGKEVTIFFSEQVRGKATIRIFDMNGRMQLNSLQLLSNNQVSLKHKLMPGIYVVSVMINDREESKKIIIQ